MKYFKIILLLIISGCSLVLFEEEINNTNTEDFEITWNAVNDLYPCLEIKKIDWERSESCVEDYKEDLEDSHAREERAIKFYGEAAAAAESKRVKEIFKAFLEVETDHLKLSEVRLK